MIMKYLLFFLALILFVTLPSCEIQNYNEDKSSSATEEISLEKTQISNPQNFSASNSEEDPLNLIQNKYGRDFAEYIVSIKNTDYKNSIMSDESVVEAVHFFYKNGFADALLNKKVSPSVFIKLNETLKNQENYIVKDYIKNSLDIKNDNAAALIIQSNLLDWDVALSVFICKEFNIPYFIVSNRDGSYINPSGNPLKLTLDMEDGDKKTDPMYNLVSPTLMELQSARAYGDTYRVKTDKTKKETLEILGGMLQEYDTVYFFINTHAKNSISFFSSGGIEYINAEEIFTLLKMIERPVNFKMISSHCYDYIETELAEKLVDNKYIEYSFLNASSVQAWEGDLLEAIIYSNDGIITIDELQDVSSGIGHSYKKVSEWGENFYIFNSDRPPYTMDIYYDDKNPSDFILKTNSEDFSIFYYRSG